MAKANNETNKLTTQRLSIQIGLNGLSFCILEVSSNTIVSLKEFKKDRKLTPLELLDYLKFVIDTEHLSGHTFDQVLLIYRNELSTLVPKAFFNEDNLADYLKFNNKILPTDFISHDEIKDDLVNVYVPYININNFIFETFGSFTYKHFTTILLEDLLSNENLSLGKKMYLNVDDSLFETIVISNGKLLFSNTFNFNTKEDFIYYILFTAEQLKMDPETFPLVFIGDMNETSELFQIAYKYVRHVDIMEYTPDFLVKPEVKNTNTNPVLLNSLQ